MSPKQRAREAMREARAASRAARQVEVPTGVPECFAESTQDAADRRAQRAWALAEDACRLARMDAGAEHCARQVRALVFG